MTTGNTPHSGSTEKPHLLFYQFLAAHSLLIGLLPFFISVYLWQHGLGLAGLCIMMGLSGLSFCSVLGLWQRVYVRCPARYLIWMTFILEVALVAGVGLFTMTPGSSLFTDNLSLPHNATQLSLAAAAIGILNGVYNAFFWTTQRTLFLQQLGTNDTGRRYGNFQLFVTVFLKLGILLGGFLLEKGSFIGLLAISTGVSFASASYLVRTHNQIAIGNQRLEKIRFMASLRYQDNVGSKTVFAIDGIFLYLESHFWILSMFLVVKQDFKSLGITVVILAISFAILFFLIKNRIDSLPRQLIYRYAVLLYSASWLLRFTLDETIIGATVLATLVCITFFSTFFRLAFNKHFFNNARSKGAVQYLLIKSYSSQAYLGSLFLLAGIFLLNVSIADTTVLQLSYLVASVLSLAYLCYKEPKTTV